MNNECNKILGNYTRYNLHNVKIFQLNLKFPLFYFLEYLKRKQPSPRVDGYKYKVGTYSYTYT